VVEDCRSIIVNSWSKEGLLAAGNYCRWTWKDHQGAVKASMGVWTLDDGLELTYTINPRSEYAENICYRVPVVFTKCNYGGRRPWFICPRCSRRVGKLYLKSKYYLCRHCNNLSYACRNESEAFRLLHKAQRINDRLLGPAPPNQLLAGRPKGMHWKTYNKITHRIKLLDRQALNAAVREFYELPLERKKV
jgi:hypothetical protein